MSVTGRSVPRRCYDWLRVVLPPGWAIGVAVLIYAAVGVSHLFTRWAGFQNPGYAGQSLTVLAGSAFVYGAFRVVLFHPLFRPTYYEWLRVAPWRFPRPLPLGPVHLVWQDLVVVGGLVLVRLLHLGAPALPALNIPLAFLTGYLVPMIVTFTIPGSTRFGYAVALGLAVVYRLAPAPVWSLLVAAGVYGIVWIGLRRMLARFEDWDLTSLEQRGLVFKSLTGLQDLNRSKMLGWPFDKVSLKRIDPSISWTNGLLLSLVVGAWVCALSGLMIEWSSRNPVVNLDFFAPLPVSFPELMSLRPMWVMGCLLVAFGRLVLYCWEHLPPLSLAGRLFRFRWIIPGYDRVLVVPLMAIGLSYVLPVWLLEAEVAVPYAAGITTTTLLALLLCGGPTLQTWQLTGNHRIVPGALRLQMQQEVQRV